MIKFTKKDGAQLIKAAQDILDDPIKLAEAKEYFNNAVKKFAEQLKNETKESQFTPVDQSNVCDHGVVFDEEDAKKINDSYKIRIKYPRLHGLCPKGCGYNGIAYASFEHYTYGDY